MLDFLNEANWWCLLLLLILAFILGWLLATWALKNKYKSALDECERKNAMLKNANYEKANSTFSSGQTNTDEIKAVKTRDHGGLPATDSDNKPTPTLNFESFGKADESQKDDLKLISGVGPFIEQKLNSIGIYTFDQISKFDKEDIDTVTELIQFFPGRIERDNWKAQAEKLKNK